MDQPSSLASRMSNQQLHKEPLKTLGMPISMAPLSVSEAPLVDPPKAPRVMIETEN